MLLAEQSTRGISWEWRKSARRAFGKSPLFVMHYGAGSSGLSFALLGADTDAGIAHSHPPR